MVPLLLPLSRPVNSADRPRSQALRSCRSVLKLRNGSELPGADELGLATKRGADRACRRRSGAHRSHVTSSSPMISALTMSESPVPVPSSPGTMPTTELRRTRMNNGSASMPMWRL